MTTTLAQRWSWLHTWSGLLLGWVGFSLFLIGTLCVFWMEISYWAQPELHAARKLSPEALTKYSEEYLHKLAPDSRRWFIYMMDFERNPILVLNWLDENDAGHYVKLVPDGSGREVKLETTGGRFFVDYHWTFNRVFPDRLGRTSYWPFMLVGAASLAFLIGCLSGLVVHRKIFENFFTFRPHAKSAQQRWLDAHNVVGVLAWPFHVMIIVTGLIYFSYLYIPSGMQTIAAMPDVPVAASGGGTDLGLGLLVSFGARYSSNAVGKVVDNLPPRGNPAPNVPLVDLLKKATAEMGGVSSIMVTNPRRDNAVVIFRGGRERVINLNTAAVIFDGATGQMQDLGPNMIPIFQRFFFADAGLHFAMFGGHAMRLLYFLCGAAGTALIGSGLIKFTTKRRAKAHSAAAARFYEFVDRANVAAMAGCMFACIAYLWGVRLLPYDLPTDGGGFPSGVYATIRAMPFDLATRADWELYTFWIAWGVAAVHAALRTPRKAWVEQLGVTAALCIGLPAIGYLVPNSGLLTMIAAGDWKVAAVDLSSVGIGVGLAWAAWKISAKHATPALETRAASSQVE